MAEDYAPVTTPEDEEEERRRQYPPAQPVNRIPAYVKEATQSPDMYSAVGASPGNLAPLNDIAAAPATPRPMQTPAQTRLRTLTEHGAPPVQPLHGWKKALDVAGKIFMPKLEQELRYQPQEEYARNLKGAQADVAAENAPQEAVNKQAQEKATTKKTEAETENLANPPEQWAVIPGMTGPNGEVVQQEKTSGKVRYAPDISGVKPIKAAGETQEQNKLGFQAITAKVDAAGLATGPKEIDKSLDAALKRGVITPQEHAQARSYQAANQTPGTNLTVHVAGAQQAQNFQHNEKKEAETYKRYETAQDAEQRLSRMEASYAKALKGDQQAMLALLTDHIGMTLGLQKGARITKDILHEAAASMPWLEKIASKFDSRGYLSGVTLGPEQMAQMLDLGYEARDRAVQGAEDSSKLYGVAEPPGAAEIFGKRKPGEKPALQKPTSNGKTLSTAQIQQAAKDHNVSVDEAKRQAQAAGYTVQ